MTIGCGVANHVVPVEYGVPVRSPGACSLYAGRDAAGRSCLYGVMGQETESGALFVLRVDPATGACQRFDTPKGYTGCRSALWSERWNRLFMYANTSEHIDADNIRRGSGLLVLDPSDDRIVEAALPGAGAGEPLFATSIAEAPDGTIWLGSCRSCEIHRFDPASGALTFVGLADDVDQYAYVYAGADGTVAVLVKMTRPHVVAYDRASHKFVSVGPVADVQTQHGHVELLKRADGNLYVSSHEGAFRISGSAIAPVAAMPPPLPPAALPDGSTYRFLDGHAEKRHTYRHVGITPSNGALRILRLEYMANGTAIYLVRNGSGGRLYGSSVLPLHFFSCDADGANMVDHGAASTASGEVYSMAHMDGKVYFCSYTHAILSVYDPKLPWSFGVPLDHPDPVNAGHSDPQVPCRYRFGPDDNPRQLGRMDNVAYRPRDMVCGPAGKVWVVSLPDYGMWGGTLSWYDPRTDRFGGAHRDIIPACSPAAITYLPEVDRLALGFIIYGGSGTVPKAKNAGFALWDPTADALVWRGDLGLNLVGVMDLENCGNGLAYAIIHPQPENVLQADLLLIDMARQQVVMRRRLDDAAGWPLEVSFQRDDQYLYGATREAVYRVPLGSVEVEVLWRDRANGPSAGGALNNGNYIFASYDRLRALPVVS